MVEYVNMKDKLIFLIKGQIALFKQKKRDKNTWIFSSTDNSSFNYNSEYLFLYVRTYFKQVKPLFIINDEIKRKELQKEYGNEYFIETVSLKGMMQAMEAGVWITSAGLPVYAIGAGKDHIIINLWHGVPLKKIALMEENFSWLKKLYFKKLFSENYRFIITTSKKLIPIMSKSFGVDDKKIKVWGQPRNDVLFDSTKWNKSISDFVDVDGYNKVILYAPTYRDYGNTKWFPFDDFDKKILQKYLEEKGYLLCLRAHTEDGFENELCFCKNIVSVNADVIEDITEYLYMFDMLITDYSSIYIDYMLLNRPIIFLPYDKQEYLGKRGFNFEYDEVTPGLKPATFKEFMLAVESELVRDTLRSEREIINDYFNEVKEKCSKNICEKIYEMRNF